MPRAQETSQQGSKPVSSYSVTPSPAPAPEVGTPRPPILVFMPVHNNNADIAELSESSEHTADGLHAICADCAADHIERHAHARIFSLVGSQRAGSSPGTRTFFGRARPGRDGRRRRGRPRLGRRLLFQRLLRLRQQRRQQHRQRQRLILIWVFL